MLPCVHTPSPTNLPFLMGGLEKRVPRNWIKPISFDSYLMLDEAFPLKALFKAMLCSDSVHPFEVSHKLVTVEQV